jgi:hypothetical protein
MSKWGSERQLHLTSDCPEVGITETVNAEVEVAAGRYVRIKSGVLRPGVQVTANQRELDAACEAVDPRKLQRALPQRVPDLKIPEHDV